ncbi:MAG TPA: hypothetical protein VKA36_08640 [Solirubrobacterales bacterium]|nr:hypothetical protein [Solirubrobacterales bacterium]
MTVPRPSGFTDRAPAVVSAVLASGLIAACGGASGGETSEHPRESRVEPLTARPLAIADPACTAAQRRQERERREVGGDQLTLDDRARLLVDLAPHRAELAETLAQIEPPAGAGTELAELVRAARARAGASTRAGRLWQRGGDQEAIAAAAAREHDERLLFVDAAKTLDLRACAERLSPSERAAIGATLDRALTSGEAARRCREYGERYLAQEFAGGVSDCATAVTTPLEAERVRVRELQGMDEVFAVAQIDVEGGGAPGRYRARITFEDGAYRIDKLD